MKDPLAGLRNDPKKTMALIAVLAVVGIAVYFYFLLIPQIRWLFAVSAKAAKAKAEVKAAEADIAKIGVMKANIAAYDRKIGRYEKVLPTEAGIPTLLEDLSSMARESNMKILGIVPVSENERPGQRRQQAYSEIPISITARSGYHELIAFMDKLENSDRFMKVADILIRANPSSPKKHDVELSIATYILLGKK